MYRLLIGMTLLASTFAQAAESPVLGRTGLLREVVGNTLHFQGGGDEVFEYLDPAGPIRAESLMHGKFSAHWRLLDDRTICFESADPMSSGCVSVRLDGNQITLLRRDGVIEGPFELLAGNPRKL